MSLELVTNQLKALLDNREDTKNILEENIKNKIYINEGGERFALAYIYLIDNEFIKSYEQMQWLFDNEQSNPMLSQLYINYLIKTNKVTEAKKIYETIPKQGNASMESTNFTESMESVDSMDSMDSMESMDSMDSMECMESMDIHRIRRPIAYQ